MSHANNDIWFENLDEVRQERALKQQKKMFGWVLDMFKPKDEHGDHFDCDTTEGKESCIL